MCTNTALGKHSFFRMCDETFHFFDQISKKPSKTMILNIKNPYKKSQIWDKKRSDLCAPPRPERSSRELAEDLRRVRSERQFHDENANRASGAWISLRKCFLLVFLLVSSFLQQNGPHDARRSNRVERKRLKLNICHGFFEQQWTINQTNIGHGFRAFRCENAFSFNQNAFSLYELALFLKM